MALVEDEELSLSLKDRLADFFVSAVAENRHPAYNECTARTVELVANLLASEVLIITLCFIFAR